MTLNDRWRRGAVLIPILARAPHGVIFIERAQHLRRHPGQIGFPGGIEEPADSDDPVTTALREFGEELGVDAECVKVVGQLPEVHHEMNRFIITPIVGVLDEHARFSLDGEEIVGVFAVPLEFILTEGAVREDSALRDSRGRKFYALEFEGRRIWGFTGRILKSFADVMNEPSSALRAAIFSAFSEGTSC